MLHVFVESLLLQLVAEAPFPTERPLLFKKHDSH
jgi:hypothetical protein